MIVIDINYLYNLMAIEIYDNLIKYNKDELIDFANKNEIPVKSYESKNKIVLHLSKEIEMTGIFRRISKKKGK